MIPHTHGGTDAPECTPYGVRCPPAAKPVTHYAVMVHQDPLRLELVGYGHDSLEAAAALAGHIERMLPGPFTFRRGQMIAPQQPRPVVLCTPDGVVATINAGLTGDREVCRRDPIAHRLWTENQQADPRWNQVPTLPDSGARQVTRRVIVLNNGAGMQALLDHFGIGDRTYTRPATPRKPVACPRCGHDNAGDPTRKADGDHLVIVQTPLVVERTGGTANEVYFTASQRAGFTWCSHINELDPPPPPAAGWEPPTGPENCPIRHPHREDC